MFGKETTGPENAILNECKGKWDEIDKKKTYKTLDISDSWLENKAKDVVEKWFSNWGPQSPWGPRSSFRETAKRSRISDKSSY